MERHKNIQASLRRGLAGILAVSLLAAVMGGCDVTIPGNGNGAGGSGNGSNQTVPNNVPTLTFSKPNANLTVYVGQTVQVAGFASDTDDPITIKLYYDRDKLYGSGDEVLLGTFQKDAKDYTETSCLLDTSNLAPGTYYLLGVVDDGVNPPVVVYNDNKVTVLSSTPTISLTEPFGPRSVEPAENLVIKWTQYAPLGNSSVTFFYDTDQTYSNGTAGTITTLTEPATSTGDRLRVERAGHPRGPVLHRRRAQ